MKSSNIIVSNGIDSVYVFFGKFVHKKQRLVYYLDKM